MFLMRTLMLPLNAVPLHDSGKLFFFGLYPLAPLCISTTAAPKPLLGFVAKQIDINKTYQRLHGEDVFTTPKTRKSKRKVPIPDFLCRELQKYMDSRYMLDPGERLFPVTKSYLSHEMDRGCKNTGVKRIRIHDIRHSHASLLINQGCDALILADKLGHEKVSTTLNTYSHPFPHKQQELVSNLEQLGTDTGKSPSPEPPERNILLETMGISYDMDDTSSDNKIGRASCRERV